MASGAQAHSGEPSYEPQTTLTSQAPPWLKPARAVAGLVLLVAAWGAIMLAFLLASYTLATAPHRFVLARTALYVAGALGVLWLGVVALACLIAASFFLMLALTSREW